MLWSFAYPAALLGAGALVQAAADPFEIVVGDRVVLRRLATHTGHDLRANRGVGEPLRDGLHLSDHLGRSEHRASVTSLEAGERR